jgi:hypothetical protein
VKNGEWTSGLASVEVASNDWYGATSGGAAENDYLIDQICRRTPIIGIQASGGSGVIEMGEIVDRSLSIRPPTA